MENEIPLPPNLERQIVEEIILEPHHVGQLLQANLNMAERIIRGAPRALEAPVIPIGWNEEARQLVGAQDLWAHLRLNVENTEGLVRFLQENRHNLVLRRTIRETLNVNLNDLNSSYLANQFGAFKLAKIAVAKLLNTYASWVFPDLPLNCGTEGTQSSSSSSTPPSLPRRAGTVVSHSCCTGIAVKKRLALSIIEERALLDTTRVSLDILPLGRDLVFSLF